MFVVLGAGRDSREAERWQEHLLQRGYSDGRSYSQLPFHHDQAESWNLVPPNPVRLSRIGGSRPAEELAVCRWRTVHSGGADRLPWSCPWGVYWQGSGEPVSRRSS